MQDLSFYRTNLCHEDLHFRPDSIVRRVLLDYTQECCQHGSSVKSDLLKKKKIVLVLTCLNTVIVLNSLRLGVLLKVAMLLVLSLTSVLTAIDFQRNYLNIKSWEIGSNKCLYKI